MLLTILISEAYVTSFIQQLSVYEMVLRDRLSQQRDENQYDLRTRILKWGNRLAIGFKAERSDRGAIHKLNLGEFDNPSLTLYVDLHDGG